MLHGRGVSGPSEAGRREDMKSQQEKIWDHDVRDDLAKAFAALEVDGTFKMQDAQVSGA